MIQFIDYGDCEEVNVDSLRSLPYDDLIALPPQVSHICTWLTELYFSVQCLCHCWQKHFPHLHHTSGNHLSSTGTPCSVVAAPIVGFISVLLLMTYLCVCFWRVITLPLHDCLSVCLFVCLSGLLAYVNNHTTKFHAIFWTCCLWPQLLLWLPYDTLCTFSFVDDVIFRVMSGIGHSQRQGVSFIQFLRQTTLCG